MPVSHALIRASRAMGWLSLVGAVLVPLLAILVFLFPERTEFLDMNYNHLGASLTGAIPIGDRLFALSAALIPAAIAAWGLAALVRLFRSFAMGEVFSQRALHSLSKVTMALFLNVVAAILVQAPISYLLSRHTAHREVSLGFGSDDVEVLFLAGASFVIARAIAEAQRIARENESFV
jgi:hypothetical protein